MLQSFPRFIELNLLPSTYNYQQTRKRKYIYLSLSLSIETEYTLESTTGSSSATNHPSTQFIKCQGFMESNFLNFTPVFTMMNLT